MPRTTFFTTGSNSYLFSFKMKQIVYANPIIESLYKKDMAIAQGEDATENQKKVNDDYSVPTKEEEHYYTNKYLFLKKAGFFEEFINKEEYVGLLNASDVEYELSNLSTLVFEITERCNLQCRYCFYGDFYHSHEPRNNRNLSVNDAIALIKYLIPKWESGLNNNPEKEIYIGFYGGEPLLNFSFIKKIVLFIKEISQSTNLRFRFNMTTNGILLNKHIDFIVQNNFVLTISIDGDEFANSYRLFPNGSNSYQAVMKNIHLIKREFTTYFDENIRFNAVLHDRNNYISIQEFIRNEFDKSISGSEVNPLLVGECFRYTGHIYDFKNLEHKRCFLSTGESLDYNLFMKNFTNNHFNDLNDLYYFSGRRAYLPTGTCNPFSRRMFVTANGKILPCETIGHEHSFGEIENETIHLNCEDIAKKFNTYFHKLQSKCNVCYRTNFCKECLFLNIITETNSLKCASLKENEHKDLLSEYYNFFEAFPGIYAEIWRKARYE